MKREILTVPNSKLLSWCPTIHDRDTARRIEQDLLDSIPEGALGLAAPQIGFLFSMFVMRGFPRAFVNPTLELDDEWEVGPEGCLSIPGEVVVVNRAKAVRLRALNADTWRQDSKLFKLRGTDARVAQHEFDHLNGVLITSHVDDVAEREAVA